MTVNTKRPMADIQGLLEKYKHIEGERFFEEVFSGHDYGVVKDIGGKICLDVGALAGEFAAYVYDNFDTFYCIEPYSKHYEELVSNVREFGLDKIKPLRVAIVGDDKNVRVDILNRGGHHINRNGTEKVPLLTLSEFVTMYGIDKVDLLKIDAESGEREIFSSSDFKDAHTRFPVIVGEHLKNHAHNFLVPLGYKANNDLYTL